MGVYEDSLANYEAQLTAINAQIAAYTGAVEDAAGPSGARFRRTPIDVLYGERQRLESRISKLKSMNAGSSGFARGYSA